MKGPFPVNATLVFDLPTGAAETDPLTGNSYFVATTPLEVQASLATATESARQRLVAGIDSQSFDLYGRCVLPTMLPDHIVSGTPCRLMFEGKVLTAFVVRGTRSRWAVEPWLGERIFISFERPG